MNPPTDLFGCSPDDHPDRGKWLEHLRHRAAVPPTSPTSEWMTEATIDSWMPDDAATHCTQCNKAFTTFGRRRHHCRLCGRIFCYECSGHRAVLPRNIQSLPLQPQNNDWARYMGWFVGLGERHPSLQKAERVCDHCFDRVERIKKLEGSIIMFSRLDLEDLASLAICSKKHAQIASIHRTMFRDIQFKLPSRPHSEMERDMIYRNLPFCAGHARYLYQAMRSIDWDDPEKADQMLSILSRPRRVGCHWMKCVAEHHCHSGLGMEEAVGLIIHRIRHPRARSYLVDILKGCEIESFRSILPALVLELGQESDNSGPLFGLLIQRSCDDKIVRNRVYWLLNVYRQLDERLCFFHNQYQYELAKRLGEEIVWKDLVCARKIVKIFETMPNPARNPKHRIQQHFRTKLNELGGIPSLDKYPLIVKPDKEAHTIDVSRISVKRSATSPIIIPFMCAAEGADCDANPDLEFEIDALFEQGESVASYRQDVMFKRDCLIKDMVVVSLIRLMDHRLRTHLGLDASILTYDVLPTSKNSGLIEIVPRSETIYSIRKSGFTIQNYILEMQSHVPLEKRRDNFIKSTAAYCVISFLLGIGDRHLDNMMVSEDGQLFHIDYGFIMGDDPKPVAPAMRIPPDVVDALGGGNSTHYAQFKVYALDIYRCLRGQSHFVMDMLSLLVQGRLGQDDDITLAKLDQEIANRFVPGETDDQAERLLFRRIDDSSRATTPQFFIDFFHYQSREYSLGSSSVISGVSSAIGKMWPFGQ